MWNRLTILTVAVIVAVAAVLVARIVSRDPPRPPRQEFKIPQCPAGSTPGPFGCDWTQ